MMHKSKILALYVITIIVITAISGYFATANEYTTTIDISAKSGDADGITCDGTYIYIVDPADTKIYKYTIAGVYVSTLDTHVNNDHSRGITTNGTHLWTCDESDDIVYRYKVDGTYKDQFAIAGQSGDCNGITNDGTYIYIVDDGDNKVYRYTLAGAYQDSFDVTTRNGDATGITTDGEYIRIIDATKDTVYIYDMDGTPNARDFNVSDYSTDPTGIAVNGTTAYVLDSSDDNVYTYDLDPIAYSNIEWTVFSDKYEFTWDAGNCTDYVMLRKKADDYPTDETDGSLVGGGNVTSLTEIITDYSQNEETYYSMWAFNATFSYWHDRYNFTWQNLIYENISEEEYYSNVIVFEGNVNSTGTAFVNYSDSESQTTNATITVYEINGSTNSTVHFLYYSTNGTNSFQQIFAINTSNNYEVILNLNHSNFGWVRDYLILYGSDRNITSVNRVNDIFDVFGDNNVFGWASLIGFLVLVVCLFGFDSKNTGVALIVTGGVMLFLSFIIGATIMDGTLSILFIVLGVLVQWMQGER